MPPEKVDKAVQIVSEKREQQLLAELDTSRRMCRVKDQQILKLKEELQAKQVEMFERREKEMLAQIGIQTKA